MTGKPVAVVLLSGGLDSSTCTAIAQDQGFEVLALSFRYGQRHALELVQAARIAATMGVKRHVVIDIDLGSVGGSALTSSGLEVPKGRDAKAMESGVPVTYVPARNTIFLSFALAWAEVVKSHDIFIGVNALDYSGYPDCRPAFVESFEKMANLATREGIEGEKPLKIHTPLIHMTKAEIIRTGIKLGVDYSLTTSCYDPAPTGAACGQCDACFLRLKGFKEAGLVDPAPYLFGNR
jgi:7-cyano-7-deazaguanine synthase